MRGLLVRENGHTSNPHRLVTRLVEQFRREGGEIAKARALGFRLDGELLTAIRTDAGELPADAAIVCAGAWSKPLAAALGDRIPLETERGYHLMIRDPEAMPRIPTADADGKFVATRWSLVCASPARSNWRGSRRRPTGAARNFVTQARRMLPGLAAEHPEERITMWMGHRPALPDSLPVIGPSRASPDVIYAFGHGHIGMTSAPMTGRVVADLVAGRPPDRHFSLCPRPVRLKRGAQ